uniref:Uncharacterized protein n=1 Tax=uncultured prokaryote TaxID=198431 RepID=A0A0H5Q3H5_9ZZZZ|nr:hypothetical protein [uncultured prokaryote]
MKRKFPWLLLIAGSVLLSANAMAQETVDSVKTATVITLDDALKIALSENASVRVADKEIERTGYAKKGAYAALFPQIDLSGSFQRTIKKQVMYMDMDMSDFLPGGGDGGEGGEETPGGDTGSSATSGKSNGGGIEVGRWNTYSGGVSASMPIINAQLWKSIKISGMEVELAVEKARSSRLDMVTQVKQAYYSVLLAKEALNVYKEVYDNAVRNFEQTTMRYKAQKASELDYTRSKATVASAIPNVYNAESSVILALWQLKAIMGVELDQEIDVAGSIGDYAEDMAYDPSLNESVSLDYNTTMRQLAIQAEQLAENIKLQKLAYAPTLGVAFAYNMMAMTNDFKLSFASEERMVRCLGLHPGSVSPLGLINDMDLAEPASCPDQIPAFSYVRPDVDPKELFPNGHRVKFFLDGDLRDAERISFHPCDNTASVILSHEGFFKFLELWGGEVEWINFFD